jgi:hypothetical protein
MGLSRSCSRLSAIAVIVAAGLVVAACGGGSSTSGTSSSGTSGSGTSATGGTSSSTSATTRYTSAEATVIGKSTHVVVNPEVSAALKQAGISVTAVAPATAKTTLLFPVSGGQIVVATLGGTIYHTGGLTYRHSGKSVTLTNFIINTMTKRLTATVGGQSKPIFDLNLASHQRASSPRGKVVASTIKLTVTSQAASALNSGLGVSAFKAGMNFGIARLIVAYARGRR